MVFGPAARLAIPPPCIPRLLIQRSDDRVPGFGGLRGRETFLDRENINLHPTDRTDQPVDVGRIGMILALVFGLTDGKPSNIPCSQPDLGRRFRSHTAALLDGGLALIPAGPYFVLSSLSGQGAVGFGRWFRLR